MQTQLWSVLEPVYNKTMKANVASALAQNEVKAPQFFLRFDLP